MSLQERLDDFRKNFESGGPPMNATQDIIDTMHRATDEIRASGIMEQVLKAGDRAPEFSLSDSEGTIFSTRDLLAGGSLVVTFYRGVW